MSLDEDEKFFENIKKELNTLEDWKLLPSSTDEVFIWSKRIFEETYLETIKFETIIDCKPEELLFLYQETDYRTKWNDQFKEASIIEQK